MAEMITVACKLPHGIHMDLHEPGKPKRRFTLKGNNSSRVIGGYGITTDVPKDFFDKWMSLHKDHPAVSGKLIFAHQQLASLESQAKERAELKHGMEPINGDNPVLDSRLGIRAPAKGEPPLLEKMDA